MTDKKWADLHANPPENWREVWSTRNKISRFDLEQSAVNFITRNQNNYEQPLKVALHPKDGYVVYHD